MVCFFISSKYFLKINAEKFNVYGVFGAKCL